MVSDVGPDGPALGSRPWLRVPHLRRDPQPPCTWRGVGIQTLPDRPGPPPTPCSWCPLLWVGLQALSHGFGGCGGLSLLPILQALGRNPRGKAAEKAWGPGRSGRGELAHWLRVQPGPHHCPGTRQLPRALGVAEAPRPCLPLQHPLLGGWSFPALGPSEGQGRSWSVVRVPGVSAPCSWPHLRQFRLGCRAPCWRLGHRRSKQMSPEPLRTPNPTLQGPGWDTWCPHSS